MLTVERSTAEFEAMAARARAEFYRGGGPQFAPVLIEPADAAVARPSVKLGAPCPGQNEGWKGAIQKGLSVSLVVLSAKIPEAAAAKRLSKCLVCAYCSKRGGKHYCGCCRCPVWNFGPVGSDLEYKVTKAAWQCPRPDPAFGPWIDGEDEDEIHGDLMMV